MDTYNEQDAESGYEASNEAVVGDSSITSEPSSIKSHISTHALHEFRQHSSDRVLFRRELITPAESTGSRYLKSSSPPEIRRQLTEHPQNRRHERLTMASTDPHYSISSSSSELSRQPTSRPSFQMDIGMTAREAAERAQDRMLIRAGLQKTPAQLIKRRPRLIATEEQSPAPLEEWICEDCRRRNIQCPHEQTNYEAMPDTGIETTKNNKYDQPARNPFVSREHEKHYVKACHQGEVDIKKELEAIASTAQPRKRGRPSKWQERRAKEDARLAEKQNVSKQPIDEVKAPAAIPKRKMGRPEGWRKTMGVSYGDFARMSREEQKAATIQHELGR